MAAPGKENLRAALLGAGAVAVGFARAGPVDAADRAAMEKWIAAGNNAGMQWMRAHIELRADTGNVLHEARTLVSLAFPYGITEGERTLLPGISVYARGEDYHAVLKNRVADVARTMFADGSWRVCVDSAPLPERWWAVRAGVGYHADNGAVIVPGIGPEVFLAELLLKEEYEPDAPSERECLHCGACRRICPTGALQPGGTVDCRRCLSYLTIEHRGPWLDPEAVAAMATEAGRHTIFGCDRCISVCPLRKKGVATLPEFHTSEAMTRIVDFLDKAAANAASGPAPSFTWAGLRNSPLRRAGIAGLLRNLANTRID